MEQEKDRSHTRAGRIGLVFAAWPLVWMGEEALVKATERKPSESETTRGRTEVKGGRRKCHEQVTLLCGRQQN